MAGKVHGQISREDAWRMWQPYGDRIPLDSSLYSGSITPFEAVQIAAGSDFDTQDEIRSLNHSSGDDDDAWLLELRRAMSKPSDELIDVLSRSHEQQQRYAKAQREKALENSQELAAHLGRAASLLAHEGIFTKGQAEIIHSWLTGPDGLPYFQYTPLSRLEYARFRLQHDKQEADLTTQDATDYSTGVIYTVLWPQRHRTTTMTHNRTHESVHANMSGLELYDVTRADGLREPQMTVAGHLAAPGPSTEVIAGDDYSDMADCELYEGWTDFIGTKLMVAEPRLGRPLRRAAYGGWRKTVGEILQSKPELFRVITDTALIEAAPRNPTSKRDALAEMHDYADRKLGRKNALTALFRKNGGSLTDIFTKGA